ncbi:MAG: hypothetical protein R3Y12_04285 [Clostridia bacterium]
MNKNLIKFVGISSTILGIGATLISGWVEDKKMEEKIEEKVNEALAKREEQIEDEL